jgi:hypothetical protein
VINVVEEAFDIRIDYPPKTPPVNTFAEFKSCSLWPFTPSVAMTARQKVLLVYGRKNLCSRRLNYLFPHHGYSEWPSPSDFRDVMPTHKLRLVLPCLQVADQMADILIQFGFKGLVIYSVYTWGSLPI